MAKFQELRVGIFEQLPGGLSTRCGVIHKCAIPSDNGEIVLIVGDARLKNLTAFGVRKRSFSAPSVTRKTDKGLPQYRDFEDSDVFILSEAEDLVPALVKNDGQWFRQKRTFAQGDRVYVIQHYRPRIEGLFACSY